MLRPGPIFGMRAPWAAAALLVLLTPGLCKALPGFACKTGLACSACHEVWPRLNDFGQSYRDRGYRLERGRDAPIEQSSAYWPLAMRTTVGYQWLRQTLVQTDAGPATTQTGAFGFTGLDVLSAGTLADKVSYLVTYTPGLGSAGFGPCARLGVKWEPQRSDLCGHEAGTGAACGQIAT